LRASCLSNSETMSKEGIFKKRFWLGKGILL
jgi:hypothetical protein